MRFIRRLFGRKLVVIKQLNGKLTMIVARTRGTVWYVCAYSFGDETTILNDDGTTEGTYRYEFGATWREV